MTAKRVRGVLRTVHIALSFMLGFYVYGPAEEVGDLRGLVQVVVVPVLAITGVWMWQQRRVSRWLGALKRVRPSSAAASRGDQKDLRSAR